MRLLAFAFLVSLGLHASPFSLIKKETRTPNTQTLLVIGGIHGNEPGSYFAGAILSEHYRITKGNLWIIPDLNRQSIQENNRGINGDLNRKFADISPDDPDYEIVREVQKIIVSPEVGLILNLHDGHGFYRKKYLNTIFNPNAWGQTCVIDQQSLDHDHPFGHLDHIATQVSRTLNGGLIEDHHFFDVRNTNTRFDDEAMRHSLTYYAVTNHKPAFAIETSKHLPTLHHKVFYQLRAIECYMELMGIEFERSFSLEPEAIRNLLELRGNLTINNNFYLKMENLRNSLSFIPLKSGRNDFKFSHPLGSVRKKKSHYDLFIGNRKIASLLPNYAANDDCINEVSVQADGQQKTLSVATDFFVTDDFKVVNHNPGIRLNVIGFTARGVRDESNLRIRREDLDTNYSVDTSKKSYRLEFYRENRFCGMVLVHFK